MSEKNYRAELVGVFGDPVDGNPTGVLEEAGFAAAGLNYRYLTCRVPLDKLGDAMLGMRALGMRGLNLTMPLKIAVIPYLDELTPAARIIGAVNTLYFREGRLVGENTDGKGFVRSLTDADVSLSGRRVTILGAGGAAKAIGVECALAGAASIAVINRSRERGEALVETIAKNSAAQAVYLPWTPAVRVPDDTQILINATCVGLKPDADRCPDIDYARITPEMVVCDVVFNPAMPLFLQRAQSRGARVVTGLGMLVNQGALNFEIWTGVPAPREVMMRALMAEFES